MDHILGAGKEGVHIFNLGTGTGATVLEVIVNSIIIIMVFDIVIVHTFDLGTQCHSPCLISSQQKEDKTDPFCVGQVIAAFSEASGKKIPHVIAPR